MEETTSPPGAVSGSAAEGSPRWMVVTAFVLAIAVLVAGVAVIVLAFVWKPAMNEGDSRIQVLEGIVSEQPDDVASRRLLAFAYQQSGMERKAIGEYKKVLSADPRDPGALYNSGLLYLELGRDRQGEKKLQRVLELVPSHALAAKALAEHYAKTEKYDRIGGVVRAAAEAHPEMADLQFLAGLGYEKTGDVDEAEARYRRALELVPDMSEARAALDRIAGAK